MACRRQHDDADCALSHADDPQSPTAISTYHGMTLQESWSVIPKDAEYVAQGSIGCKAARMTDSHAPAAGPAGMKPPGCDGLRESSRRARRKNSGVGWLTACRQLS